MGGEMVNGLHKNFEFTGNARLNKTDTRKLQQALKDRGFYKSTVDGIWGGQTTQAILDYQAVNMQPLTGTVNAGTLTDLGVYIDSTYYANR
jgi:peptidoglycan hydrolase-like protein with peptidoglycan-binding domain